MVSFNTSYQGTLEEAYKRAKERGDKSGARALLIQLRKERERREGRETLPTRR